MGSRCDFLTFRRNVGFWCEMGLSMQVGDLERAVRLALRALAAGENVLVHCRRGKHRSGAFLCFLLALIRDKPLQEMIDEYCTDYFLWPGDRRYVERAVEECGLRTLIDAARGDSGVRALLAELHAKCQGVEGSHAAEESHAAAGAGVEASGRQGVEESRAAAAGAGVKASRRGGVEDDEPAAKRQRSSGASSSSGPTPSIEGHEVKPGDWRCPECGNWNYAWRTQCNFRHCPLSYWKRGDWTCPACGNHNYASRSFCNARKCGAPNPF